MDYYSKIFVSTMMVFGTCNYEFPYNPNKKTELIDVAYDIRRDLDAGKNFLEDFDHQ